MLVKVPLMIVDDDLVEWFNLVGFWNEKIRLRSEWIGNLLPLDIESEAKDHLAKYLGEDCICLLKKLLAMPQQDGGMPIQSLGFEKSEFDQILEDGDCACAILKRFNLLKIKKTRTSVFLKPTAVARDPRIAKLMGIAI